MYNAENDDDSKDNNSNDSNSSNNNTNKCNNSSYKNTYDRSNSKFEKAMIINMTVSDNN